MSYQTKVDFLDVRVWAVRSLLDKNADSISKMKDALAIVRKQLDDIRQQKLIPEALALSSTRLPKRQMTTMRLLMSFLRREQPALGWRPENT